MIGRKDERKEIPTQRKYSLAGVVLLVEMAVVTGKQTPIYPDEQKTYRLPLDMAMDNPNPS